MATARLAALAFASALLVLLTACSTQHEANTRRRHRYPHPRSRDSAAAGRGEEALPGRLAQWQPRRRVLLAARRQARKPGDARLREGRERLRRRHAGAHQGARNQGLQRDHRPPAAGRLHRAVSHERLLVLPPLRDRQGISHLRAPQGHAGRARRNPAERQRDWRRATTSSKSATSPSAPTASSWPGPKTPSAAGSTSSRSWTSPRTRSSPSRCPTWKTTSSGPATTRPSSTSRRIRRRCSGSACAAIASTAPTTPTSPRIRWSGTQKTRASTRSSTRTKDEKYLLIHTQSTVSTEVWYADAASTKLEFKMFLPRERDHEYQVEHANGRWIVRTNCQAKNFRIVEVTHGAEGDRDEVEGHRRASRRRVRRRVRRVAAISSPSRNIRAACASCASVPGTAATDVFVTADEPSYTMALDVNREFDSDKLRYTYHVHGDAAHHLRLRLQDRQARVAQARAGARRLRPGQLRHRVRLGHGARRHEGAGEHRVPQDHAARRHRAAAADRLWLVRLHVRSGVLLPAAVAARSRLRRRHRAHPRRPGDGPRLVRERQAAQQEELVHGLHRRDALARGQQVHRPEARVRDRPLGRRPAHGRHRQHGARRITAGIVTGVPFVDVVTTMLDEIHSAHHQRVRRVGQSEGEGVLRLHAVVFAV